MLRNHTNWASKLGYHQILQDFLAREEALIQPESQTNLRLISFYKKFTKFPDKGFQLPTVRG
jgi:hypothetical protein